MKAKIIDPQIVDKGSNTRGGGRFVSLFKDYLADSVEFVENVSKVKPDDTLIVPFFQAFQKPFLTKRIAKKQILIIYDVIPLKYSSHFPVGLKGMINRYLNTFLLKNYDTIVTISQVSKQDIIKYLGVPTEKIKVIYPTLSKELRIDNYELRIRKNNPILNSIRNSSFVIGNYCLYVGDVNWNKNIVNIAKAVKLANIPTVFVGKAFEAVKQWNNETMKQLEHPWQSELKSFIQKVKDNPLFIFPGYVSNEELNTLYANASLNLLVSRDEGFGFSYLEASNISTPSLLSDTPIFHEIASDAALFADPENPEEIAKEIQLRITNDELRIDVGEKAKERTSFFSPERFKEEWKSLL